MFAKGSRSQVEEDQNQIGVKKELKKVWSQEGNYISVSEDRTSSVISCNEGLTRVQDKDGERELMQRM
jgi:hypothetical protein